MCLHYIVDGYRLVIVCLFFFNPCNKRVAPLKFVGTMVLYKQKINLKSWVQVSNIIYSFIYKNNDES